MFLAYKCVLHGVKLILVNPAYTSLTCHKCLHIHPTKGKSYRHGKDYHCQHCGWKGDAECDSFSQNLERGKTGICVVTRLRLSPHLNPMQMTTE